MVTLQMGDQRLVIGLLSSGSRSLRASDNQGRFQRFDVVWQGFNTSFHEVMESQNQRFAATFFRTPELF